MNRSITLGTALMEQLLSSALRGESAAEAVTCCIVSESMAMHAEPCEAAKDDVMSKLCIYN